MRLLVKLALYDTDGTAIDLLNCIKTRLLTENAITPEEQGVCFISSAVVRANDDNEDVKHDTLTDNSSYDSFPGGIFQCDRELKEQ